MCDRVHSETDFVGRAVEIELVQYPPQFDGQAGNALARVLSDVASRRVHQIERGYDHAHDDAHDAEDLEAHIQTHLHLASRAPTDDAYRDLMVDVAALAVAALERWDRPAPVVADTAPPMRDCVRHPWQPESAAGERRLRQMQKEILYWLRRTIGERMGRSGEAAIATVTGGMRVTHLIPAASDLEAVQAAIKLRWGVSLTIRGATTVADLAAHIVVSSGRADQ